MKQITLFQKLFWESILISVMSFWIYTYAEFNMLILYHLIQMIYIR